jgi:AraC-like DNA-binding protein
LFSLEPSAARQLLGTPLHELVDVIAPVEDISRLLASRLVEAMTGAAPLVPAPRPDRRLAAAERMLRAGATVARAAAAADLSPRQLERCFTEELGLRPKTFGRIVRFRRACDGLRRGASLADAAAEAGYADQSHFARDCQNLGAITPAALRSYVANVQDLVQGDFATSAEQSWGSADGR